MTESWRPRFARYAWFVLAYNVAVILWGAYVRATGSGAGCGSHWPLCNGAAIPRAPQVETIIEFTHRLTSGLSLLLILGLLLWAWRSYPKGHRVRLGAGLSTVFIIVEALFGALLVLQGWVAQDTSSARAVVVALHLANTFLLLAALTLTGWWASGREMLCLRGQGVVVWGLGAGLIGVAILGMSGAITALGDTLFPVSSLAEGLRQDLDPSAHFLIRLRVWHPVIAIAVGGYTLLLARLLTTFRPEPTSDRLASILGLLFVAQLAAGAINLAWLAPIPMQIIHLLLADLVWIALVLLAAATLRQPTAPG
jgi:heme A synthase